VRPRKAGSRCNLLRRSTASFDFFPLMVWLTNLKHFARRRLAHLSNPVFF
jgi:hypothetical protein